MPAEFTTASTGRARADRAAKASIAASSVTSSAVKPAADLGRDRRAARLVASAISTPSRAAAKRRAVASPMPLAPPVTTATLASLMPFTP